MLLGNKMREEKNSPEEKIIFQPRQETATVEGYERLAALCVEDEAPSPERSSVRKPGGAKPESSG